MCFVCVRTRSRTRTRTLADRVVDHSCAKCGIATWCSEECLEVGFEQHQEVCRAATDLLNQLGL